MACAPRPRAFKLVRAQARRGRNRPVGAAVSRSLGRWLGIAVAGLLMLGGPACSAEQEPGAAPASVEPAELVLLRGKLATLDAAQPEAEALAVRGGRIAAVGSTAQIEAHVGPGTRVIDLAGRRAVPGFIEGHGHYLELGQAQQILDLTQTRSWDDIVAAVAQAAASAEPGEWIEGRGWHQEKWERTPQGSVDGVPPHAALSAVSPANPVVLGHASGHAAFANALALERAGIGRDTPDPDGGTIVRDVSGEATGLLRENADGLVYGVLRQARASLTPAERWQEFERAVALAGREALAHGVTSFHDAGANFESIDGFKRLADAGQLPVRLYVMVRGESDETLRARLSEYRLIGYGGEFLTVRSIKRQIDGALGSHGAWLLEPYADMPSSTGLAVETPEAVEAAARIAAELGFQVNTHAIGDRANREVLDIYQRVFAERGGLPDHRWRIEHAQHLHPSDVPRFAELGLIASMQGIHCTSDAPFVLRRLGPERAQSGAYLWRSFLDSGVRIANGTDAPVEPISPIASLAASVVRRDREGNEFFPAQRMTRAEALRSYTLDNAYAGFEENLKGSLSAGKLADIAVLDRDILSVPEAELAQAQVDLTILGGQLVFERGESGGD
jgi:predicted amidohydrolase YtcJ